MIKIVSKTATVFDLHTKKPIMYRVIFTDGTETWFGDMDLAHLRQRELYQQFEESGYNMKSIEEYYKLAYQEGTESTYKD